MEWVLVVSTVLFGDGVSRALITSPMPDKETCYEALANVQHELLGPEVSDKRRALGWFVALCVTGSFEENRL